MKPLSAKKLEDRMRLVADEDWAAHRVGGLDTDYYRGMIQKGAVDVLGASGQAVEQGYLLCEVLDELRSLRGLVVGFLGQAMEPAATPPQMAVAPVRVGRPAVKVTPTPARPVKSKKRASKPAKKKR